MENSRLWSSNISWQTDKAFSTLIIASLYVLDPSANSLKNNRAIWTQWVESHSEWSAYKQAHCMMCRKRFYRLQYKIDLEFCVVFHATKA